MLNQLTNLELWLIISLSVITPTVILLVSNLISTKKQLKIVTNLILETKETCDRLVMRVNTLTDETKQSTTQLADQVNSLSSSNELVIKELQATNHQKIYPRPSLVDDITKTIEDQMSIELILSSDLSAPRAGYLERISDHVIQTYPEVDTEYIIAKCTTLVQAYIRSKQT